LFVVCFLLGNYPEENIQHTEHDESLKSRSVLFVHLSSIKFWRGDGVGGCGGGGGGGGGVISIQPFKAGEVLTLLTRKQIKYFRAWFITAAILRSILTLHVTVYSVNSALLIMFRHVVMCIMSLATSAFRSC
jgi:hypothetical protein